MIKVSSFFQRPASIFLLKVITPNLKFPHPLIFRAMFSTNPTPKSSADVQTLIKISSRTHSFNGQFCKYLLVICSNFWYLILPSSHHPSHVNGLLMSLCKPFWFIQAEFWMAKSSNQYIMIQKVNLCVAVAKTCSLHLSLWNTNTHSKVSLLLIIYQPEMCSHVTIQLLTWGYLMVRKKDVKGTVHPSSKHSWDV